MIDSRLQVVAPEVALERSGQTAAGSQTVAGSPRIRGLSSVPTAWQVVSMSADERVLLVLQYSEQLADLTKRIVVQRAVTGEGSASQRWRARRLLRRLETQAAEYREALDRLRRGTPKCRGCGAALSFELLLTRPMAEECGAYPTHDPAYAELRLVTDQRHPGCA